MTANDLIITVKNRFVFNALPNEDALKKLYFVIETNIDSGLKKLAAMVSESERYVALQKMVSETLISHTIGIAQITSLTNADILLDSVRERGFILLNGRKSWPVWSYDELLYPITDTSISRYLIAGGSIFMASSSFTGSETTTVISIMGNYIPTLTNLPDAFIPDLVDLITQSVMNSPDVSVLGLKLKEDKKDS